MEKFKTTQKQLTGREILGDDFFGKAVSDIENQLSERLNTIQNESRLYCKVADETIVIARQNRGSINPESTFDIFFETVQKYVKQLSIGHIDNIASTYLRENHEMQSAKISNPNSDWLEDLTSVLIVELGALVEMEIWEIMKNKFPTIEMPNEKNSVSVRFKGKRL